MGNRVKKDRIIGGDFHKIMDDAEKDGGRRKPRASMEEFFKVIEELGGGGYQTR